MWGRAVLLLAATSACYSPSIESCALACAGTACPDGLTCVGGMCAAPGTTSCGGGSGSADAQTEGCGDGESVAGEFCFGPLISITSAASPIFDAQLFETDEGPTRDLAYLGPAGYLFRAYEGGVFADTAVAGPVAADLERMRAANLNGGGAPEIVHGLDDGMLQVWSWTGSTWMLAGMSDSTATGDVAGIRVAQITAPAGPPDVLALYPSSLQLWRLSTGLTPMHVTSLSITGGVSDLAAVDITRDGTVEMFVAGAGIEVIDFTNVGAPALSRRSSRPLPASVLVSAMTVANVDGDNDADLVYISSPTGQPTSLGVVRWQGPTWMQPVSQTEPGLFGRVEAADLDRDGKGELITVRQTGPSQQALVVWSVDVDGGFVPVAEVPIPTPMTQLHANADYNGDGVMDIVVTASALGRIHILPSNP